MSKPSRLQVADAATLTPSQQMVKDSLDPISVTDKQGRTLVLRNPSTLAKINFPLRLGAERAANQTYMATVMPLLWIESLDGKAVVMNTPREIDVLVERLGDDGIAALTEGMKHFFPDDQETPKDVVDTVKN
jgi:hypothetical protein